MTKLNARSSSRAFARGSVPRAILEKTYRDKIEAEVSNQLVEDTYFDAVELVLDPLVHPEITEIAFKDGSFVYVANG